MFVVGLIDDIREISAPAKVIGTIAAAGVLTYYGVTMFYFRVPFVDVFALSDDWVLLVTVIWLLGMTQAINLIDGLDGLAAGIVAIGAAAFFIYSLRLGDPRFVCCRRRASVRWSPSSPSGSASASCRTTSTRRGSSWATAARCCSGLLMAVSTSVVGGRADPNLQGYAGQTYFFLAPLFIPLFILGVPILDTLFAIIRRATASPGCGHGRQASPAPPPDGDGPRAAAQRGDPVGVDGAAVGLRAVPGAHPELRVVRSDRSRDARAAAVHAVPSADPETPIGGAGWSRSLETEDAPR